MPSSPPRCCDWSACRRARRARWRGGRCPTSTCRYVSAALEEGVRDGAASAALAHDWRPRRCYRRDLLPRVRTDRVAGRTFATTAGGEQLHLEPASRRRLVELVVAVDDDDDLDRVAPGP